jgi:DHA2 family multidrug resistance protein
MAVIGQQSLVLAVADAFLILGVLALALIPLVSRLAYIPPPATSLSQR